MLHGDSVKTENDSSADTEAVEVTYRDRVATIDGEGKRKWIYPKKPSGRFFAARTYLSWALLAFLFLAPFIRINGHPMILLNVLERKFVLFGMVFWPQDFHIFVLIMIAGIVFIFLFTAVYGRLFCGWICPQTIFMEMVFRKIEYLIEGNARRQRTLRLQPWNAEKLFKKGLKHAIFFGFSFVIGNLFLAYIIGVDELLTIVTDPPSRHLGGFVSMLAFSGTFYFIFAFFREQVCTLVCPYGRLQSVLLDENSIVISYDFKRGEPRKLFRKDEARAGAGDCIDCRQCVVVCPTGIDIRDGTQLECINCTACIDACDEVMDKVGLPRGLVRYASHNSIASGRRKLFTARVLGYTAVLAILMGLVLFFLTGRGNLDTTILRASGTLYQLKGDTAVTNLYTLKILNKTFEPIPVVLRLLRPEGKLTLVGTGLVVPPDSLVESAFFVELPVSSVPKLNNEIEIGVYAGEELLETVRTTFMGPAR